MKVIKVVNKREGKLISTFAEGKWQKEYVEGVETKPDTGCLFAYSRKNMTEAQHNFRSTPNTQYWLADAEVVGKVKHYHIDVLYSLWDAFWGSFKLQLRNKGAEYLLCSSITLIKRLG